MAYRTKWVLLATIAWGAALGCSAASAADLDGYAGGPEDMPEQKVEFGSGWYIRGDIGANRLPNIQTPTPALPTVTNQIPPSAPNIVFGSGRDIGYTGSLGAGYQFNRWFRSDLVADFHEPLKTSSSSGDGNVFCPTGVTYATDPITGIVTPEYANGGCTGNYQANLKSYDVLINGYLDLGTWYRVTPYIGAGVGLSFGHYQTSATYVQANNASYDITYNDPLFGANHEDYDRTSSGTFYNFAFALMAGFSVDVFDHTKLDIGYRYLNLGSIPGGSGTLTSQEVRAGLRYMVDN